MVSDAEFSGASPDECSSTHSKVWEERQHSKDTVNVQNKKLAPAEAPETFKTSDEQDKEAPRKVKKFDKKKNAEILASKYTATKRLIETISIVLFSSAFIAALFRSLTTLSLSNAWAVVTAFVLSMFIADFFSGIMHWGADTWGSLETPVVGQSLIRSFREHHVKPTAICDHDWIEANGDNCAITLPFVALAAFHTFDSTNTYAIFIHNFLLWTSFWAAITNQIHKWSHTYKLPAYVVLMQKYGFILSKRDHAIHHRNPFDKYYCITNGWLNPVLANIGFWKSLESIVTYVTGYVPREDDHLWTGITAQLE